MVNDYHVPHMEHTFKATAPAVITKTTRDYFWLLPNELNTVSSAIIRHTDSGYDDFYDLKESLRKYWIDMVLKKAEVATQHTRKKQYSLRTVRALRATEWVRLVMEYRVMKWEPEPPNPLTHTDWSTTLSCYASKGCESTWEARRRCCDKFGNDPDLQ